MSALAAAPNDAIATERGAGRFQVAGEAGGVEFFADERFEIGGLRSGPRPNQLLAAALAACTTMTLRQYADQKRWNVTEVQTAVGHSRENGTSGDIFSRTIEIRGELDAAQSSRLMEIADRCPVHRTLVGSARVATFASDQTPRSEAPSAHADDMAAVIAA
ncbi:OsmC family protein [Sphingomonas sp. UYP23]